MSVKSKGSRGRGTNHNVKGVLMLFISFLITWLSQRTLRTLWENRYWNWVS